MNILRRALALVKEHRRALLALNLAYFGLVVCAMLYVTTNPGIQQELLKAVGQAFTQGPLAAVGKAYGTGEAVSAVLLTFIVNLTIGSFATITLPSLVIPFSGMLMGVYRALLWGMIYAPTSPQMITILIPHSITLLIEGEAYVLVMLAVYIQGRALLQPSSVGATSRPQAYATGLKLSAQLYVLVLVTLVIAALYEVAEALVLMRVLG